MQDPLARLLSAYRMQLSMKCYRRGRTPGDDCALPAIDVWLEERLAAAAAMPESVYPPANATVRVSFICLRQAMRRRASLLSI